MYYLLPGMTENKVSAALFAGSLLAMGLFLVSIHLVFYVSGRAFEGTMRPAEHRAFRLMHSAWLIVLRVMALILIDLLAALLYALTPAGTADGYAIH